MSERKYEFPNGTTFIVRNNQIFLQQEGEPEEPTNVSLVMDLIVSLKGQRDSLQQILADRDRELSDMSARLHKESAERDRTIARQSAALETATDALNGIKNGEWVETIDDQFLEVWTTRRINPSRIADEALLEISRELEALGRE
ncbi:hypothetical protein ABEW24_23975 [Paenibacillus jamilae]|uniref:hypothetical protein n=1 Tax=Paenibacillus TaxID=44249 RepID=UPI00077C1CF3|nr:hypothetical protein [Paenibacillus polymyxa]KYG95711.1 hypothetical protein AZE31_18195 [Paenibacillus polymyxa]